VDESVVKPEVRKPLATAPVHHAHHKAEAASTAAPAPVHKKKATKKAAPTT